MSAQWQQQCRICKRILFEHKLHFGPFTSAKLQGMEREDRGLAVIEILQDDSSSDDLILLLCKLREVFEGSLFPNFHLTIRAVRRLSESLSIDRYPAILERVSMQFYRRKSDMIRTLDNFERMLLNKQKLCDPSSVSNPSFHLSDARIQQEVWSYGAIMDWIMANYCQELECELAGNQAWRNAIFETHAVSTTGCMHTIRC